MSGWGTRVLTVLEPESAEHRCPRDPQELKVLAGYPWFQTSDLQHCEGKFLLL